MAARAVDPGRVVFAALVAFLRANPFGLHYVAPGFSNVTGREVVYERRTSKG